MTLNDKKFRLYKNDIKGLFHEEDIKESIRELKERFKSGRYPKTIILHEINEVFGKELVE